VQRRAVYEPGHEPFPGYRLRQVRGRGAFAEVWEAQAPDGTLLALKFMTTASPTVAAREVRSIQAIKQLRHPGLIRIDQVWFQPGSIVVGMELADGSLLELLDAYQSEYGTNVPPAELCLFLRQAAHGIDFLNARQHAGEHGRVAFQHCDIKPSNILLFGDTAKLADFGLSTATKVFQGPFAQAGTLDFAAPEVFQGQISDRSDQYALAVSYCYLRGGRFPFPEVPDGRFSKTYVRPTPDLSMLSEAERPILLRALAPKPIDRWPNCLTFMDELASRILPRPNGHGHVAPRYDTPVA
jgi:serine/threonine-protein kinase